MILALDFDGVICNSINECMVTSFGAYTESDTKTIIDLPSDFIKYFYKFRYLVRPAGEYYLICRAYHSGIEDLTPTVFMRLKAGSNSEIGLFGTKFFSYRQNLKDDLAGWIKLHSIYDHVEEFLRVYKDKFFVVTTKDRASVELLSNHFKFNKKIIDIFSREVSENKNQSFNLLCSKYSNLINGNRLVFVDDSPDHLGDLVDLPLDLYFAKWGYSPHETNRHFKSLNKLQELL